MGRRASRLAHLGLLLIPGLLLTAVPSPTAAADGGLVVLAQTRYVVQPAAHRVHVTVEAVATSFEPDTSEGQVYYSGITFAVQPGATNVAAFSGGQQIGARIIEQTDDFTSIEVTFGRGVFFRQSYAYVVSFDLVDPGGEGTRDLRIGESLAAFPIWAFGTSDEPGSSVRVELPGGYTPDLQGSEMSVAELPDGGTVLGAEPVDPFDFFAYLSADRPGAFTNRSITVDVHGTPADVLIRAWQDDPEWGKRVTRLLRRGLPALQDLIGVDYPGAGRLSVEEAATSRLGEYAGIYNTVTGVIRVRYDADAFVTMHEAAHIWFNGSFFADRWINEAWAEYYGVAAGRAIGANGATIDLTDELLAVRIPLNDWGAIGVESLEVEDFGYAATYSLAQRIAERAEVEGLQLVWQAADAGEKAYQPIQDGAEPDIGVPFGLEDWKRLLDLLEERTDAEYADLWREWVVNDEQQPLIAERQSARHLYDEVVAEAGTWELPESIRTDMAAWEFETANEALTAATEVLDDRDAIEAATAELRLTAPDTLREAFEGDAGLAAADDEADAQLATLELLAVGDETLTDEPALLESIGLIGNDPAAELEQARSSFEDGELAEAEQAAARAIDSREAAADAGRVRVMAAGAGVLILDGAAMAYLFARRRRSSAVAA